MADDANLKLELYNEQLEQQVLGCILIQNNVLRNIELELNEESFYFEIHKHIFNTIKQLLQEDKQADEQTVYYSLADSSNISLSNDDLKKYISSLISIGAGSFTTPKEITKILNFLALKRQLSIYNKEINSVVAEGSIKDIDEKIGLLEQQIYSITNNRRQQDSY